VIRRSTSESGSTSLEMVLLAPVLLSVMLLIAALGRYSHVEGSVDQAAADAARSATATRDLDAAKTAVQATIDADLSSAPTNCRNTENHVVTTSQDDKFEASSAYDPDALNVLTVTVSCQVDVSDLSFIGFGSLTVTRTFSSPIPANYGTYP
jgi:Flp pilus assembly protein TadG